MPTVLRDGSRGPSSDRRNASYKKYLDKYYGGGRKKTAPNESAEEYQARLFKEAQAEKQTLSQPAPQPLAGPPAQASQQGAQASQVQKIVSNQEKIRVLSQLSEQDRNAIIEANRRGEAVDIQRTSNTNTPTGSTATYSVTTTPPVEKKEFGGGVVEPAADKGFFSRLSQKGDQLSDQARKEENRGGTAFWTKTQAFGIGAIVGTKNLVVSAVNIVNPNPNKNTLVVVPRSIFTEVKNTGGLSSVGDAVRRNPEGAAGSFVAQAVTGTLFGRLAAKAAPARVDLVQQAKTTTQTITKGADTVADVSITEARFATGANKEFSVYAETAGTTRPDVAGRALRYERTDFSIQQVRDGAVVDTFTGGARADLTIKGSRTTGTYAQVVDIGGGGVLQSGRIVERGLKIDDANSISGGGTTVANQRRVPVAAETPLDDYLNTPSKQRVNTFGVGTTQKIAEFEAPITPSIVNTDDFAIGVQSQPLRQQLFESYTEVQSGRFRLDSLRRGLADKNAGRIAPPTQTTTTTASAGGTTSVLEFNPINTRQSLVPQLQSAVKAVVEAKRADAAGTGGALAGPGVQLAPQKQTPVAKTTYDTIAAPVTRYDTTVTYGGKTKQEPVTAVLPTQSTTPLFRNATRTTPRTTQGSRSASEQIQSPAVITTPAQVQVPQQRTAQELVTRQASVARTRSAVTVPPVLVVPPTLPQSRPVFNRQQGFDVYVRRRGKFEKVNVVPLVEKEANLYGAGFVSNSAAASYRLAPADSPAEEGTYGGGDINWNNFVPSKKQAGVIVQKVANRIRTAGEKAEITYKGIAANKGRRKNNGIFG